MVAAEQKCNYMKLENVNEGELVLGKKGNTNPSTSKQRLSP